MERFLTCLLVIKLNMAKGKVNNTFHTEISQTIDANHTSACETRLHHQAKNSSEYLSFISQAYMFPILAIGIFTCYSTYGYLQEVIIFQSQINPSLPLISQYLVGLVLSTLISLIISKNANKKGLFGAKETYCGVLNNFTMTFSNYSLMYVDYPTATLAKSSKVLPVMLLGLIQKTYNYSTYRYVWASVMTFGLIVFNFAKLKFGNNKETANYFGYILLVCSLLLDGVVATYTDSGQKKKQTVHSRKEILENSTQINNSQESTSSNSDIEIIKIEKPDPFRMMLANNVVGLISSIFFLVISFIVSNSEITKNVTPSLLLDIFIIGLWGSIGQIFTYMMINRFNCFLLSIVNTSRKFFSVLFSIFYFNHHVTMVHWIGVALVLGSIIFDVIFTHREGSKKDDKKKN